MSHEVQIQHREAQPYAAIPMRVTVGALAAAVDQAFPELFGWLAEHAVVPAGAPLIRYLVVDMAAGLQIDLGVPAGTAIGGSGRIISGTLPAGRYAVLRHAGPYDRLIASHAALQEWAQEHGVALDSRETPEGTAWRGRVERYLTNPAAEPDPARWEVDVAYLVRES